VYHEVYLDNNSTTRLSPEVRDAICLAADARFGNPSSEHRSGELARRAIARARDCISRLIQAHTHTVIFGSGATELNNWVILNALERDPTWHLVVSTVEHSSVLEVAAGLESQGVRVTRISVNREGIIQLEELRDALREGASLVSIQWVNNETGTIQPVQEISRICAEARVPYHCDAAQAVGKLHVDVSDRRIDFLTFSAHKMHGPTGVGAMVLRDRSQISPMLYGGAQEYGLRAGTENILGIVGFGRAAETRAVELQRVINHTGHLRDHFESEIKSILPSIRINGCVSHRVSNTTNVQFPNLDGAAIVALLDREGIRCSQTSACTSSRPQPSHVLVAMGLSEEEAYSSVRFSFCDHNTLGEVGYTLGKIGSIIQKLQSQLHRTRPTVAAGGTQHEV